MDGKEKGASSNFKGKGKIWDAEEDAEDEIVNDHLVFGLLMHPPFRADVIHMTLPYQVFNMKRLPLVTIPAHSALLPDHSCWPPFLFYFPF